MPGSAEGIGKRRRRREGGADGSPKSCTSDSNSGDESAMDGDRGCGVDRRVAGSRRGWRGEERSWASGRVLGRSGSGGGLGFGECGE